ncbi:hypothetical protein OROGR_024433 [Orobanche gracilis]
MGKNFHGIADKTGDKSLLHGSDVLCNGHPEKLFNISYELLHDERSKQCIGTLVSEAVNIRMTDIFNVSRLVHNRSCRAVKDQTVSMALVSDTLGQKGDVASSSSVLIYMQKIKGKKSVLVHKVPLGQDVEIKSTIDDLVRKVDALVSKQSIASSNSKNELCISCAESFHASQYCPSGPQNQEIYNEEINALHSYGKSSDSPFAPTYNPNWRNHPNFSWKQNMPPMNQGGHQMNISNQQNVRPNQYPLNTYQYPSTVPKKPSLEDTLQQFMQSTQQMFQSTQQAVQSNSQSISKLETQIGQLATTLAEREKGKFPSQPTPNPKGQYEVNSSNAENQMNKDIPIEESKIELNPLPESLKYAFLGPSETLPVIIASDLDEEREDKLINVHKEHKEAIGWTISDIKVFGG